jgi:multicomponent Na+:H+ antiporter subunit C
MTALSIIVFLLFTAGIRLLLLGGAVRAILALLFLSNAANLIVFRFSGMVVDASPIIAHEANTLTLPYSDPLPQALVLTAIVIGLGVTLYLSAMVAAMLRNPKEENRP